MAYNAKSGNSGYSSIGVVCWMNSLMSFMTIFFIFLQLLVLPLFFIRLSKRFLTTAWMLFSSSSMSSNIKAMFIAMVLSDCWFGVDLLWMRLIYYKIYLLLFLVGLSLKEVDLGMVCL